MYEWINDLRSNVLLNSISVISGRWADDYERLCAMELRLRLKLSPLHAGLESETAKSIGQRLNLGIHMYRPRMLEIFCDHAKSVKP